MRHYRISVAALMSAILVFALGFAALHAGTIGWSQSISGLVAMTLAMATSGALFTQGTPRAFWGGMAVFGWQFFVAKSHTEIFDFFPSVVMFAHAIALAFHPLTESPIADPDHWGFDSVRKVYLIDAGGKFGRTKEIALGLLNLIYAVIGGLMTLGLLRLASRQVPSGETGVSPD